MQKVLILSRVKRKGLGAEALSCAGLAKKLESATDMSDSARNRLVRRILAGWPSRVQLRTETDPKEIVTLLRKAGAEVVVRLLRRDEERKTTA